MNARRATPAGTAAEDAWDGSAQRAAGHARAGAGKAGAVRASAGDRTSMAGQVRPADGTRAAAAARAPSGSPGRDTGPEMGEAGTAKRSGAGSPQRVPDRAPGSSPTGALGALGRYGEQLAARRLTEAGLTILARNWRAGRSGEIDIVARDGDAVVVCEVKTRRGGRFQHPMAAVTPAKAERLRGLAERWLHEHGGAPPGGLRIDVVGVLVPDRGAPVVEHVRGVA